MFRKFIYLATLITISLMISGCQSDQSTKTSEPGAKELRALLVGQTEIGTIVRPSRQDFGKAGDTYEIRYLTDGTLEYRDGSKRVKGFYTIFSRGICRAPEKQHVQIRCRTIHRDGDRFLARGASSGLTRYEFKIR